MGWPRLMLRLEEVRLAWPDFRRGRVSNRAHTVLMLPCRTGEHRITCPCFASHARCQPDDRAGAPPGSHALHRPGVLCQALLPITESWLLCRVAPHNSSLTHTHPAPAAWHGARRALLTSDAVVTDGEMRSALSHHQRTGFVTSAAGWVHLRLFALMCDHTNVPRLPLCEQEGSLNPAEARAERKLEELLDSDTPHAREITPGIAFVRQVRCRRRHAGRHSSPRPLFCSPWSDYVYTVPQGAA